MKTLATIIAMLVCTASASPQLPDASALMEKSRAQMLCGSLSSKVTLTITEKNGTISKRIISMNSKSFSDDSEKRFIKFLEPADVRGTSMLISDYKNEPDEMWIWLPALKKTRRIVSTEKGKSFMSSEFTNSDMSSPSASEFTNNHAQGSGNGEYWIIESIPGDQEKKNEMGYSKKVTYMKKSDLTPARMEFHDVSGKLFKVIEIRKVFQLGNGKYLVSDMFASNIKNGRSSEIVIDNILTGAKVDDSMFTVQNLGR